MLSGGALRELAHGVLLQTASGALLASAAAAAIALFAALQWVATRAHAALYVDFVLPDGTVEHEWLTEWLATRPELRASGVKQLASGAESGDDDDGAEAAPTSAADEARLMVLRAADGDTISLRTRLVPGAPLLVRLPGGARLRVSREAPPPRAKEEDSERDPDAEAPSAVLRLRLSRRGSTGVMAGVLAAAREAHALRHNTRVRLGEAERDAYSGTWDWVATDPAPRAVALREVVFPPGSAEAASLLADVVRFLDSEKWYASRGIPYHRGYLLHGPSGVGKTMLAHAVASELDLSVCACDLSLPKMTDDVLASLFRKVRTRTVILVERIDKLFDKQRSRLEADATGGGSSAGLTFGGVLNVLDGVSAAAGCIIIFTSELPPGALDPALVRDGRVDRCVPMAAADAAAAAALYRAFYATHPFHAAPEAELRAGAERFAEALRAHGPGAFSHRDVLSFLSTRAPEQAVAQAGALGLDAAALAQQAQQQAPA